MKLSAPYRLRVEQDLITTIYRQLPGKGELTVTSGQEVSPSDIIGSSYISTGFRILNLSALLDVPPKDIKKYLQIPLGQRIYKGELLAFHQAGILRSKKVVTAPSDGILDFLNSDTGEVRLRPLPRKVALPAAVFGVIEEVNRATNLVKIRSQVSRIYGMMGTGQLREGTLHLLGRPDELITAAKILNKEAEHILVGGSLVYKEALTAAISIGINGIITGGINAKDYKDMAGGKIIFPKKIDTDVGITLLICEGFGSIPIGEDIFRLLKQYDDKFIFIDGNKAIVDLPCASSDCLIKIRKTKLPPTQASLSQPSLNLEEIKVGQTVRIVGNWYLGGQGRVVAINQKETLLPSGIRTYLVTVETKSRKVQLPYTNIEII